MWRGSTAGTLRASRRPTAWGTGASNMGFPGVNRPESPEVGALPALLGAGAVRATVDHAVPAPRADDEPDAVEPARPAAEPDADGRAAAAEDALALAVDHDRDAPHPRAPDAAQVDEDRAAARARARRAPQRDPHRVRARRPADRERPRLLDL